MAKKARIKLPDAPGWTPVQLDGLDAYLTDVIGQCQVAYKSSMAAQRMDALGGYAAQAAYWKNARGAFTWLRGQLRRMRQAREGVERPDSDKVA